MFRSNLIWTVSTLVVLSSIVTTAQECTSDVSQPFLAAIDNSSFFNSCAEGTTFNITSVFDVLNFTTADLTTFCNSSTCLEPIHELMGSLDCNITYQGTPRNLSFEVTELHNVCHEALDALEGSGHGMSSMDKSMDMHGNAHGPGSTTSGASSSIGLMTASVVSAVLLAVFLN